MDTDKNLEQTLGQYTEAAKENKNIDVAALMLNALQRQDTNRLTAKQKRWAYLVAIALPPLGLLYALKFYFSDEVDAREAAITCVILTVISIFLMWLTFKVLLSGSGTSLEQIQQITPQDIQEFSQ